MLVKEENFPQTDATVVLKEDAVKDVTWCADGLLHDYINYDKELMNIGSDAWSVFMDYETNCIISKKQMLNACPVFRWSFTLSHSHTYASGKCYNISVNVVVYSRIVCNELHY